MLWVFLGYRYYREGVEERALHDFVVSMKYFNGTISDKPRAGVDGVTFSSEAQKWADIESTFREGFEANRAATISCMFQLFQAEALLQQGKIGDAIVLMRQAIGTIPARSVVDFYRVKFALVLIDTGKDEDVQEGLGILESMGLNQHSAAQPQALFRLGEYYWVHKDFDRAKGYWQQLVGKFGDDPALERQIRHVEQHLSLLVM